MVELVEADIEEADEEADVGEAPPLETWRLNRCRCHGQLCLQCLDFGQVVQVTRWLGEADRQLEGPG